MPVPFTTLVQSLPDTIPFVGPEALERKYEKTFATRIGANESAFGISSKASEAVTNAARSTDCSWSADPDTFELRSLLSEKHGVPVENLCVDAGIDSLLGLTVRMFMEPGTVLVTSQGAYPTVNYHASGYGAGLYSVPFKDHHEDTAALADAARIQHARLVYLSNPDNPMGTCVSPDAIEDMLDKLPEDCLLMLDEAYVEFMDQMPVIPIDINDPRIMRYRTFSKAYGMAGMRIGYVIAHVDIIAGFNRIRNHFGVNRLAQKAAAASLQDCAFIPEVVELVKKGRQRIYDLADSLSLNYLSSSTNFVAVDMRNHEAASAIIESLASAGIFMRKPMVAPQSRFLRVGVGTEKEHAHLVSVLSSLINPD